VRGRIQPMPLAQVEPIVPFPISAPYRVRPDVHRLADDGVTTDGGSATVTRLDRQQPDYLRARVERLRRVPEHVLAIDPDAAGGADRERLHQAGLVLARRLEHESAGRLTVDGDDIVLAHLGVCIDGDGAVRRSPSRGERTPDRSAERTPDLRSALIEELTGRPVHLRRLAALSATFQEDLVLMAADDRAVYLHVAFPSGWDPGAMAGASFARLHGPVPHGDGLRRAAAGLVRAMVHKGPFVRHVWGIARDPGLAVHPREPRPPAGDAPILTSRYLRVERQTTVPLPALALGAFFIRVYVVPLMSVLDEGPRRCALREAVASMDESLRRYKGLERDAERLLRELDAPAPR
jgi:hypothetical protein